MIKRILSTALFLLNILAANSQVTVTGIVIAKLEKEPLTGVTIIEKGTQNGTLTREDGTFTLNVASLNSILTFSYVGAVTQEYPLRGTDQVSIKMKWDCNIDYFDYQKIGFFINSGIINTPLGGQFELIFPAFLKSTSLRTAIGYQTDLHKNEFLNAHVELNHLILNCDLNIDLKEHYRVVFLSDDFKSNVFSIESVININRISMNGRLIPIIGYSKLEHFNSDQKNFQSSGPLIGVKTRIGRPLFFQVSAKVSIFRDIVEYQGQVSRYFKNIYTSCNIYKLESFNEISLGLGMEFNYRLKRHKK
jgi:hypothetical protein